MAPAPLQELRPQDSGRLERVRPQIHELQIHFILEEVEPQRFRLFFNSQHLEAPEDFSAKNSTLGDYHPQGKTSIGVVIAINKRDFLTNVN